MADTRYASRKFLLALLTILVCSGLLWLGKLSDASFAAICQSALYAYIAGNVVQAVGKAATGGKQ